MFRRLAAPLAAVLLFTLPAGVPTATPAEAAAERLKPPAEKIDKHGGPVAAGKPWTQNRVRYAPAPAPKWPEAVTATVDLKASKTRVAGSPVSVSGTDQVTVRVLDRAALPPQWRDRVVMSLSGQAKVAVDYSGFRYAYGGDWASRLRLWSVPACALTTPDVPACRSTPVRSTNDVAAGVVSSAAPVKASYVVLAAAESGGDGDFSATSLAASSTWTSGGSSGDFTWNYPLRVPPATGPAPEIALAYSAQSVDGRSEVTNNQPSMIGEGFDYSPGFLERRYVPCWDDRGAGANNASRQTSDQCWKSDNATISFNGRGGELVYQAGKGWHLRNEDGTRVERLTGAANGARDGEYWKLTTTDGTQYFFGLNALPGHSEKTNSTLTVPVYGNHSHEPCYKAGNFAGSYCTQAWRWQLDYVVDVRGNTMSYWYGKDSNKYARNNTDADDTTYDRAGHLTRIDYGTYDRVADVHGVTERSVTPHAQVLFENALRCVADCGSEAAPVKANWKDTPWDQECKTDSCPQKYAPTFWTTKRLAKVTTRVWDTTKATAAWQDVDQWTLTHTFAASADSTHTGLWLDKIDHAGLVGGTAAMPPVTFGAVSKANRVLTANGTTHNWLRISDIVTETGARIHVDYSRPQCTANNPPTPHTNTSLCYPVLMLDPLDPNQKKLITEWWHKYRVEHVSQDDVQLAGGKQARSVHTWYEYGGTPAWHYADDDGVTRPERRTWSQWRGYGTVKTRVGDSLDGPTTLTVTNFLRGMHGDRAAPAGGTRTVTSPASLGDETVHDEDQFAGQVREQVVYNGTETKPVSKTVNVPSRSEPTAARGDVEARFTGTAVAYTAAALGDHGSRGWRVSRQNNEFDWSYGSIVRTQQDADIAATGDERCTTNTYNRNTAKNLTQTLRQTTVTALPCGQAPDGADDVISDQQLTYDGAAGPSTPPVYGSVTRTEQLKDLTAAAGTVWHTVSSSTYRPDGRVATATDIKGNVTTTEYTLTTVTTTGPMPGWTAKREVNPYWGSDVKVVDVNGRVTAELAYDPLGRVAKVWRLGWPRAGHENQPLSEYRYVFAPGRDSYPYTATSQLNSDGNVVTSYQIVDGWLRPRQTQTQSAAGDGNRVVTDTIHDQYGRATTKYAAHVEPGAASGTLWHEPEWSVPAVSRTVQDLTDRVTAEVFLSGDGRENLVEKWRTTKTHEGDRSTTTPPAGGVATTTVTDADGRTVALRQHTTAAGVAGAYRETRYVYDRKGHRVKVIDPAGNEWTSQFDVRGREIQTTDPDRGITRTVYNDAGETVTVTDARGEALWYGYDQIGRKTEVRDGSPTGALRAQWKYDALYSGQAGFRGQLTQSIRYEPAGSANAYKWQVRQFDARYQPTGVNYVIPAVEDKLSRTYVYSYSFAATTGQPLTMSYADGPEGSGLATEQLTTDYHDTTGLPVRLDTSLTGAAGPLLTASYTPYGEVNGSVRSVVGETAVEDVIYRDEATRRIERTTAGDVSDRRYTHDPYGNVTEITEPDDRQCFRHDRLAQLTSAWTPKQGVTCAAEPAVADLGGPAPYWTDWTFDSTGSRLTEVSHAAAGETTRTYKMPTGGAGVARPHALTEMTTTAPGKAAVVNRYTYDQAGNTVCRPAGSETNDCGNGAGSQVASWNAEGRMAAITAGGKTQQTNVYDADGTRLIRRDTAGTTLYLPGQEIRQEGTTVTGTRHYSFAGGVIAARRSGAAVAANLIWLYADHQGTQQTAVNAATHAATVRRQTPYGGPRGAQPAWPTDKGFVGGDTDPTGLTHLGAREYDPATGRFISVDPLMDLADPTQWNGYSYANNSPVSSSDPDGLAPCHGYQDGDLCPGQKIGPWAGTVAGDTARDKHFGGGTKKRKRDDRYTGNWGSPKPRTCSTATPEYCHAPGAQDMTPYRLGVVWAVHSTKIPCPDDDTACAKTYYFREGDPFTEQIRGLDTIESARQAVAAAIAAGEIGGRVDLHYTKFDKGQRGWQVMQDAVGVLGDVGVLGIFGSAVGSPEAEAFLGSYDLEWSVVGYDSSRKPVVEYHLTNATTRGSATANPFGSYHGRGSAGAGGDARPGERFQTQSVRWRETVE
ncbi:RHS repeat domain-containing protein [Actinoplanes aureus]|uniref:RHS repeat-associated core domain-containing protein n=1 Tax=Actinoplanes aureus TaxID=2792083 RepID=A0A931CNA3_9ACTN|nr:RHS repeat-associated core domain-containing protein [Actinoplanes aureus]MBG0568030.1 RHS repeat-associated core domain-containing protein [Actinoplanes aureus]